jgi:hypothetical protein
MSYAKGPTNKILAKKWKEQKDGNGKNVQKWRG